MQEIKKLWNEEDGQGLAEYGLILGLIAVACVVAMGAMGTGINGLLGKVTTKLNAVAP